MTPQPQPARRPGGRRTKFTPQVCERVLKCVEAGMPLSLAASAAGIAISTLHAYRNRHTAFAQEVEAAISRGVEARLKKIEDASNAGDWRASAWLLEHTQPQHFARNRIEVTGADGSPLAGTVGIYLPQKQDTGEPAPITVGAPRLEDAPA